MTSQWRNKPPVKFKVLVQHQATSLWSFPTTRTESSIMSHLPMTHQWLITYQWRNNYVMTHALLGDPSNSFQVPTVFSNPFLTHLGTTNAYTKITKSCRRKNHDVTIINTYLVVIYCNNLKYNHKKNHKV